MSLQRASAARQTHPGDITGRKMAELNEQASDNEAARERAIRDLRQGHGFSYLNVPGHGLAAIDTEVLDYLKKVFKR
jgi:hypothetical protein